MVRVFLMITHIVVDTSYWLELFKVPGHFKASNHNEIKLYFKTAIQNKYRLYIPIPVLFELANHIAHINNGGQRRNLASQFSKTVKKGITIEEPSLNIIPSMAFTVANELSQKLEDFVDRFELEFVQQGLGFTDVSIILDAENLKNDRNIVHIWTLDTELKAREPDMENEPFVALA
jgi:predicted nucleic acid-binding protein